MSVCSVRIPSSPAAPVILGRLSAAAARFGVEDPSVCLESILARTFARPLGHPTYGENHLQPGYLPLEWSFSETDHSAMRIEVEPFEPELSAGERLRRAVEALLSLVETHYGFALAERFASAVGEVHPPEGGSFGAFVGLVLRAGSAPTFKLYVEIGPEHEHSACPAAWGLARAVPHFRSLAVGGGGISERIYYLCTNGLNLLALESVCSALDMPDRFPVLLTTILELTGGAFHLAPRAVLLGVRTTEAGWELKVELVAGLAVPRRGLIDRVTRLMAPAVVPRFHRWVGIASLTGPGDLPVSVVSLRAAAGRPLCLSVYAAERCGIRE